MDGKVIMCATLDHFGGVLKNISQVLAIKLHDCPLKKKLRVAKQPPQKLKGGGSVTPKIEKEGG